MPIYIRASTPGRSPFSGEGKIHGVKYGTTTISPRNLLMVLFQAQSQFGGPRNSMAGERPHNSIVVTKERDSASPLILTSVSNSELLSDLAINLIAAQSSDSRQQGRVIVTIHFINAQVGKYRKYLPPPSLRRLPSPGTMRAQSSMNELEEFELTFQSIKFTQNQGGVTATDDWLATG